MLEQDVFQARARNCSVAYAYGNSASDSDRKISKHMSV